MEFGARGSVVSNRSPSLWKTSGTLRLRPVNDPNWAYDPTADSDGSGQCWLTQNVTGNSDVDDGAVRVTSSSFDLSGGNVIIGYDY